MPSHLPARAGDDGRRNVNGVRHLGNCGMNGKLPQEERNGRRNEYAGDEQEHGRGKPRRRREREDEPEDDDPHRDDGPVCESDNMMVTLHDDFILS